MSVSATRFYVTGGTLPHDAVSYVSRQADTDLLEGLRAGEFCYVLDTRQMGKSSLMVRTGARLTQEGTTVLVLDLTALGQNVTAEQWYDGLLHQLGRELDREDEVDDFRATHRHLGPLQRWMLALREVALVHSPGPLAVFIDEIDIVRSLPFSTDEFFAGIRECYNERAHHPELYRLTFCLLGVATPDSLIRDTRVTPFNIGRRIELRDFSPEEAAPLAQGMDRQGKGVALLSRILWWTGGHPYLTQRLCQVMAEAPLEQTRAGVDRACSSLFLSPAAHERDSNLLFVRDRLLRAEPDVAATLDLYAQVRSGRRVRRDELPTIVVTLLLAGIVRADRDRLRVRNRIYEHVFDRSWVLVHLPDAERRRQRAAYQRGLMRASSLAATVVLGFAALALTAVTYAQRAQKNRQDADIRTLEAQRADNALKGALNRANVLTAKAEAAATLSEKRRIEAEWGREQAHVRAQESRAHIGQFMVAYGARLQDEGDLYSSLLWYAQAALIDSENPARSTTHRLRLSATLQRVPRLTLIRFNVPYPPLQDRFLSPDGTQRIITHESWRWAFVVEAKTEKHITPALEHGAALTQIVFSPNGQWVATASKDGTARVWDATTGRPLTPPLVHRGAVLGIVFSADSRRVATASDDGTARIWNTKTGAPLSPPLRHGGPVFRIAFAAQGTQLITVDVTHVERTWDVSGLDAPDGYAGEFSNVAAITFSPEGRFLATGDFDWGARVWDTATGAPVGPLLAHGATVRVLAFSPDGRHLATGCDDHQVRIWTVQTGQLVARLAHQRPAHLLAFSPNGKYLLTAGQPEREATLWDARTGSRIRTLRGHSQGINHFTFSADSRRIATVSDDGTARIWDTFTGASQRCFTLGSMGTDLSFLKGGRWLVTGTADGHVAVWDVVTGRAVVPPIHTDWFTNALALSPNGQKLLSASGFGDVQIWDMLTGRVGGFPLRHQQVVTSALFSPNGRFIATASRDGTARIWDAASSAPITPPLGHTEAVRKVIFSPDSRSVLTLCDDGVARLWRLPTSALDPKVFLALAEVLACRKLDARGGTTVMNPAELRAAWNSMSTSVRGRVGATVEQTEAWYLAQAAANLEDHAWDRAIKQLDLLVLRHPENRQIHAFRMLAHAHLGHWEALWVDSAALHPEHAWLLVAESHRPIRRAEGALVSDANHKILVVLPGAARRLTFTARVLGTTPNFRGTFWVRVGDRVVFTTALTDAGVPADIALRGAGAFFLEYNHQGPDCSVAWQNACVELEDGRTLRLADLPLRTLGGL